MKISKYIKAAIFDMDGTLVDTEPLGIQTLKSILDQNDIKLSDKEWVLFDKVWRRDGTKTTAEVFFHTILSKHAPFLDEERFILSFYSAYEKEITKAKILPGADELLKKLYGKYKLALVTASTRLQAMAVLKRNKWVGIFDVVLGYDEYKIKKPNPISFLMAAERLGIDPGDCVVIEDSKNGTNAGKNAGMYVIGVRAGNKLAQDLSASDTIVDTLKDISIF